MGFMKTVKEILEWYKGSNPFEWNGDDRDEALVTLVPALQTAIEALLRIKNLRPDRKPVDYAHEVIADEALEKIEAE